mmetsp:Transcript_102871/g.286488  ORF Transcript_102871/g.286488 Transcript_102871/m.286488 type:complete len:119 (-) Transcript_102871:71-427(-)
MNHAERHARAAASSPSMPPQLESTLSPMELAAELAFVNLLAVALLLGFMALGSLTGLRGMANTSTVFLVLWLVKKYVDLHLGSRWNGWVLVLVLSLLTWRAALWLHLRPEFVASLLDF